MPVGTATVELSARDRKLQSGLKRGVASVRRFGRSVASAMKIAATAIIAVGTAAIGLASVFVKAFTIQEKAEAKLEAVIKATGMAAGFTADEMKKMAAELQKITVHGDEVIMTGIAILATFKEIKGQEFEDATVAMLDMATVLETDLKSAAILVGKALNDPILGATALSRSGVQFTKVQKAMIKTMQEAGDMMGAQRLILDELESQFQGAAKAVGDTFGGQLEKLKNRLGDIAEQIGEVLIKRLDNWGSTLDHLTTQLEGNATVIDSWIESLSDAALMVGFLGIRLMQLNRLSLGVLLKGTSTLSADLEKLEKDFELMENIFFRDRTTKKKTPTEKQIDQFKEARDASDEYFRNWITNMRKIGTTQPGAPDLSGLALEPMIRLQMGDLPSLDIQKDFDIALRPRFEGLEEAYRRVTLGVAEGGKKPAEKTADATEDTAENTEAIKKSTKKSEGYLADTVELLGVVGEKLDSLESVYAE